MSLSDYVSVFCSSFAPESTGIIIPFSGSDSTYTGVQILGTTSQIVEIAARDIIDHLDDSLNDIVRGVNNHYDHINYVHKETTNLSDGRIDTLNEKLTERITHLHDLFKWVIGGQLTISGVLLLLLLRLLT